MSTHDLTGVVRRVPLFAKLSDANLRILLERASVHHFAAGSLLITQDAMPEFLHIAVDGLVGLKAMGARRSAQAVVEFFGSGEPFIAPAVILQQPYLMSAEVIEDARILMIPSESFLKVLREDLTLSLAMNEALSRHWRMLIGQIKDLKLLSSAQRVAAFIVAKSGGATGALTVPLPFERRLLATRLGMVPESLSRAFRDLRALGVSSREKSIVVDSVDRLREFCQGA